MSTLEAYFKGKKELFEGLEIEKLEKKWEEYPVLHLDFTGSRYTGLPDLQTALDQQLARWESRYGVTAKYTDPSARFKEIRKNISRTRMRKGKVNFLVLGDYGYLCRLQFS